MSKPNTPTAPVAPATPAPATETPATAPAAATPTTPAPAEETPPSAPPAGPAKPAKLELVASTLSLKFLTELDPGSLDDLARKYQKKGAAVKETREDYKDATKAVGKVYCALEIRLEKGKKLNMFPANKSLAEFIKDITGEKPPTHALTLKNAVGAYVETDLIAETDYDNNSGNCLEIAARIVDAVKGNLGHDAVLAAAKELKQRCSKEAKNLRAILDSVKPSKKMDAKEALETFEQICDEGHLVAIMAHLPDVFAELDLTEKRDVYVAFSLALERIDKAHTALIDGWAAEIEKVNAAKAAANAPIQITHAGKPVENIPTAQAA